MWRSLWSYVALHLIQTAVMIGLTSAQVRALGAGAQGLWLTIASISGLAGLLVLGVPAASVRAIAGQIAAEDGGEANEAIASSLGACLALGACALLAGAGLSVAFEQYLASPAWSAVDRRSVEEARVAYWIGVAQVAAGFVAYVPLGILEARLAFVARNGIVGLGLAVRLALGAWLFRVHPSLILVPILQLAATMVEVVAALTVIRRRWPGVRFGLRNCTRSGVSGIVKLGFVVMLVNVGVQLLAQSKRMAVGTDAGPSQVTGDVTVVALAMAMVPLSARLLATGRLEDLQREILRWSKVAYSLALLGGVCALVLEPEALPAWMVPSFAGPARTMAWATLPASVLLAPVRAVLLPALIGAGRVTGAAIACLLAGLVALGGSLVLVGPLDVGWVALGAPIIDLALAFAVFQLGCRKLGIPPGDYAVHVLGKPSLGILVPILLALGLSLGLRAPLPVSIAALVLAFGLTWILYVYRGDPHFDPLAAARRRISA